MEIKTQANADVEKLHSVANAEMKELSHELIAKAESQADLEAKRVFEEEKQKAEKIVEKFQTNLTAAVKYVLEQVK